MLAYLVRPFLQNKHGNKTNHSVLGTAMGRLESVLGNIKLRINITKKSNKRSVGEHSLTRN